MEKSVRARCERIPVHVITGFLGSGKSSAIRYLLERKPHHERWALVINEFGQVGIDQTLFESRDDVVVKGLPGGCLCCQLEWVLQASLVNLLHRSRPDRVIIEPSGLGHPTGLLDLLRGEAFRGALEVRGVMALLDPRRLDDPRSREHDTFRDQLLMADAVALTMTDLASDEQRLRARRYLEEMWPRKRWIGEALHGKLDGDALFAMPARKRDLHERRTPPPGHDGPPVIELDRFAWREPSPGVPVRDFSQGLGHASLGWRWHASDRFRLDDLARELDALPHGVRAKGVWHTDAGWHFYNRGGGVTELSATPWRGDSRFEVIAAPGELPDAQRLEARIAACRIAAEE